MTEELALIFIILILNSLIIFYFKERVSIIISLICSQLAAIVLYSVIIADFHILRTFIIATVVYSITTFILVNNSSAINGLKQIDLKINWKVILLATIIASIIIPCTFYLTKNINKTANLVKEKQMDRQNAIEKNPLIFPGHPVHRNVKKYYLEKNFDNDVPQENPRFFREDKAPDKEPYKNDDREKLRNNSIIRGLSDIILVIVGVIIAIFLSYLNKKPNEV